MSTIADVSETDFNYLGNGALTFYLRKRYFNEAIAELEAAGYLVLKIVFSDENKFYEDVSKAFQWQQQFGYSPWTGNLDAFNDGLSGIPFSSSGRTAICLENYDALEASLGGAAWPILDMIEYHSRDYLLSGQRLAGLVQTNDHTFDPPEVGARAAQWNEREWMNNTRVPQED